MQGQQQRSHHHLAVVRGRVESDRRLVLQAGEEPALQQQLRQPAQQRNNEVLVLRRLLSSPHSGERRIREGFHGDSAVHEALAEAPHQLHGRVLLRGGALHQLDRDGRNQLDFLRVGMTGEEEDDSPQLRGGEEAVLTLIE